jgi:hypothetical protein
MFKRVLFVFLLALAVLAFAGYSVPTASAACDATNNCNPMFGPTFVTVQAVPAPATSSTQNANAAPACTDANNCNSMFGQGFNTSQPVTQPGLIPNTGASNTNTTALPWIGSANIQADQDRTVSAPDYPAFQPQ